MIKFIELFAGIGGFRYGLVGCGAANQGQGFQGTGNRAERNIKQPDVSPVRYSCVYSSEWNKYAASIYRRHYGEIDTRDIRNVPADEIPDHDLLTAGFPCQSFSVAGKRGGFDDTRGTLFFEIARIAKHHQPMFLLLENVRGLDSHDDGQTMQTILETLQELGYYTNYEVYNSKHFGVPQNRERIFFICKHIKGLTSIGTNKKIATSEKIIEDYLFQIFLNNLDEVKKLQEHASKDWIVAWMISKEIVKNTGSQQNLKLFKKISKNLLKIYKRGYRESLFRPFIAKQENLEGKSTKEMEEFLTAMGEFSFGSTENIWQNIEEFMKKNMELNSKALNKSTILTAIRQIIESKTYTYTTMFQSILLGIVLLRKSSKSLWREILSNLILIQENTQHEYQRCAFQTEETTITESGSLHITKNIEDFSEKFIIGHLRDECGRKVFPIQGSGGKNLRKIVGGSMGQRIYSKDGIAKTLAGRAGGQGAKTGLYAIKKNHGEIEEIEDDTALNVDKNYHKGLDNHGQRTGIMAVKGDLITRNNPQRQHGFDSDNMFTLRGAVNHGVSDGVGIRKLTPTECERLQAFPDGWTGLGITEDGEQEEISDTQRYQALGNAVTTSVITAIGQALGRHEYQRNGVKNT